MVKFRLYSHSYIHVSLCVLTCILADCGFRSGSGLWLLRACTRYISPAGSALSLYSNCTLQFTTVYEKHDASAKQRLKAQRQLNSVQEQHQQRTHPSVFSKEKNAVGLCAYMCIAQEEELVVVEIDPRQQRLLHTTSAPIYPPPISLHTNTMTMFLINNHLYLQAIPVQCYGNM